MLMSDVSTPQPSDPSPAVAESASLRKEFAAWNAPIAIDEDSSETFGFGDKDTNSRYERAEIYGPHRIVGPMPVDKFLDHFMDRQEIFQQWNLDLRPSAEGAFDSVPERSEHELDIYKPLVRINSDP